MTAFRIRLLLAGAALVLALPLPAAFGEEAAEEGEGPPPSELPFLGEGGFIYQGEGDLDGGGSVQVARWDAGLAARTQLSEKWRWSNAFHFGVHDYDFDGGGSASADAWDTVLSPRLSTRLTYALNERWGISAGGVLIASPETGADWGDAITGGGLVGVEYRASDTLSGSLGVAVISQIEDDATVAPSIGLRWLPAAGWAVRVGAVPASGGAGAAAEVSYRVADPVEVGLGVVYQHLRFRLDDSGVAPDGVGEDENLPVRLRVAWHVTPQLSLNFLGGAVLGGKIRLEDEDGRRIAEDDYDPAPYLGLRLVGRF